MKYLCLFSSLLIFFYSCTDRVKNRKKANNLFYDKAFEYNQKKVPDTAFLYFNKAKDLFLQQKDSLGVAKCLVNMGMISTERGDYFGGQEISLNALSYFDQKKENQFTYIHSNFNNLGLATYHLKDYKNALKFYESAIEFSRDSLTTHNSLNNKAKVYEEIKQYKKALKIYNQILKETNKNPREYARTLTNISYTKWLQDPNYNAVPVYLKALHIREEEKDLWGQNASYAHLADYYIQKQPDSALHYALKMYTVAKKINSRDDQLEAIQKLIKLSPPKETRVYFEIYQKLSDSLQTARNAAKNQFALIRYEAEKNKVDNLNLQKDNTEKRYQIVKQEIILFITFLLIVAASIISVLWYKKRKQRLELQAQNTIRENQLKTSKKVHDVVANGLYRVMTEIENQDTLDRDNILDKLEVMYEKSRDISYDEVPLTGENFHEEILDLLKSFANENTRVVYAGSSPDMWKGVSGEAKYEVQHILQELMVNMQKHSNASNVAVKFENLDNYINIRYTDDGVGISKELQFNNGLTNTGNRIKSINGTITFDTKSERGFKVYISFPVC